MSSPAVQPTITDSTGDLAECNREQLHRFTSIQGYGCLVAFTWPDQRVQAASHSVGDVLGIQHSQVLGARLEHFLGSEFVSRVGRVIQANDWSEKKGHHFRYSGENRLFEAYLFHTEGLFALEFERAPEQSEFRLLNDDFDDNQTIQDYMRRAKECTTLKALAKETARAVREISAFDRVMIYRFLKPHYHGEVIAEDRVASAHSFDGHRFPSSDIPKPARDLYLRNSVRMIPRVHHEESEIDPKINPLTRQPLDLSDSRLRAVSKIHLEYLRNMGVEASYSFAIVIKGQLWGLIACHHLSPYRGERSQIVSCEILASAFSARADMIESLMEANERLAFDERLTRFFDDLKASNDPVDQMFRQHRQIEGMFRTSGLAWVRGDRVDFAGLTPPKADLAEIGPYFIHKLKHEGREAVATQHCDEKGETWDRVRQLACGVLAVLVPGMPDGVLMFFRPEVVRTIVWGGDPRKQLEKKTFQGRINPRESFSAWEEVVRNQSLEWESYEINGALFLRDLVFDVLARRQSLIEELSEQVRLLRKGEPGSN